MLFVLSAPSGTGKTTVAEKLLAGFHSLKRVVTATTRPPRQGETQGVDYIFMSKEEFERKVLENYFLEYASVYGNYYGTPKEQILKNEETGFDSLLVIDVQGAKKVREVYEDCLLVFLLPPSLQELRRRLFGRGYGTENLEQRVKKAEEEIACARFFDYIVVNEFLDKTIEALRHIFLSQRYRKDIFLKTPHIRDDGVLNALKASSCYTFERSNVI